MFVELFVLFVIVVITYDYCRKKKRCDATAYLKGPKCYPVVGSALRFIGKSPEDIFAIIYQNRQDFGPMYRMWVFNKLTIFCADPKDVEVIVNSSRHITKNSLYDMLIGWLGTGLLISTGQKWHSRRKVITPTFHFKILEQFVEIFDNQSKELISQISAKADGQTAVDIYPFICRMALDIISETSMGTTVNAQKNPKFGYAQDVADITSILSKRFIKGYHRINFLFKLTAPQMYKRQQQLIDKLHDFTENVIEKRRETLEKELLACDTNNPDPVEDIGTKRKMALLDVLLQATINGKPLSNTDIREEVDTFMFEGHDTTTSGISFTLYLLSRHPAVQQKVFEEIREVIGDDVNQPIALRDLNNLNYLECIIKEGLRLYPPVPIIGRHLTEAAEINGKYIPAGTDFVIGIYVMLRDKTYFPNPHDFIPERHLAQSTSEKTNPYAYIPFSAGPRNCIGQKFAILEKKSTISKILRNFELLPLGPEIRPMMNLVTRSANGVNLGLKPRVYSSSNERGAV